MLVVWIVLGLLVLMALLYLGMIKPAGTKRPAKDPFLGVLYAHRGLHDNESDAPENSMAAFRKAVEAGFGMELDIQLSKDKVPVVFHDFTLKRVCGAEGKIKDYTLRELKEFHLYGTEERIPTLAQVLELVDGKVPLIVEFKGEDTDISLCPIADKLLREYKGLYCVESFNPLMVIWYKKHHKEIFRGQLSEKFFTHGKKSAFHFVLENMMLNFLSKPDFISYKCTDYDALSRRLCCGLFKATAVTWTIKSAEELKEMKKHFEIFIFEGFMPKNS
ncbi:MAG: glycerophosphodiester phosphodiesterase [Lachnospiraceae bacterium]|nr:glycerophosphodiester phosphodiesterase [Lachnospiraceae bacterium]MBP3351534.1 glycerophosphodiester phosphodiesterase [Lachnospiraceae bacterium]